MKIHHGCLFGVGLLFACSTAVAGRMPVSLVDIPLIFEANGGRMDATVRYLARGREYDLFLTDADVLLSLRRRSRSEGTDLRASPETLRLKLIGARGPSRIVGEDLLPTKVNFFRGSDPERWRTGIAAYGKVRYEQIHPGIDLVFYGTQGRVEYDFVVAPGADPSMIRLAFDGHRDLVVDEHGNLVVALDDGQLIQHAPHIYQEREGVQHPVAGRYLVDAAGGVSIEVDDYDRDLELVIDPVLEYSTYLGGSNNDGGSDVAVDAEGNVYLVGSTGSADFPLANPLPIDLGGEGTFVAKIDASGTRLEFATYLSGSSRVFSGETQRRAIAIDGAGNVYVAGSTVSFDFPTRNAFQAECVMPGFREMCVDAFLTKLDPTGSELIYSTYLGGSNFDYGMDVAVDDQGNAHITGNTLSTGDFSTPADFPVANGLQMEPTGGGVTDGFLAKFDPSGALIYSTYLGAQMSGIAVDGPGSAYVVGTTGSPDFPVTENAFQPTIAGGGPDGSLGDAVIAKIDATGSAVEYASFLGGSHIEHATAVAVDDDGNAYVVGITDSLDFPIRNALQPLGDGRDGFVSKISADGSALIYSTTLGGTTGDQVTAVAVDSDGHAYVTGQTTSSNFPTHNPLRAYCPFHRGVPSAEARACGGIFSFVTKLSTGGSALAYSTYFAHGIGEGIAVDERGSVYVTGGTWSEPEFPVRNALQPERGGDIDSSDAFLARISDHGPEPNAVRRPLLSLGDIDGNGTQELAVLLGDGAGTVIAKVFDAQRAVLLHDLILAESSQPLDVAVLPDLDHNGAPELAVLEKRLADDRARVVIRDSLTGHPQSPVVLDSDILAEHLAVIPDLDGNGAPEVAVLGVKLSGSGWNVFGTRIAQIRDSVSQASLGNIEFQEFPPPRNFARQTLDFSAIADVNGNGAAELALLNREQAIVHIRDAWSGDQVNLLRYQGWITPLDMTLVPAASDKRAVGIAVLGRDVSNVARTIDPASGDTLGTVHFSRVHRHEQLVAIPDVDGNGVGELALLQVTPGGWVKVEIKDAVTRRVVRNVWFPRLRSVSTAVLPDMNGNGTSELGVLGTNWRGELRVVIRDAATNSPINVISVASSAWQSELAGLTGR